jgi:hypothetical protein
MGIMAPLQYLLSLQFERDISVRRRALDLLFNMCNPGNARTIITALVAFLEHAEYAIREEMVWEEGRGGRGEKGNAIQQWTAWASGQGLAPNGV